MGIVVVAALRHPSYISPAVASRRPVGEPIRPPVPVNRSVLILGPAVFDRHVLALDVAGSLSGPDEMRADVREIVSDDEVLRNPITGIVGCCARAAIGHAAAAPPSSVMNSRRLHSITSSARASSVDGTVRPSALAVIKLMMRSNLVGCSTGMSPGFVPRRILSTNSAARRNWAGKFAP